MPSFIRELCTLLAFSYVHLNRKSTVFTIICQFYVKIIYAQHLTSFFIFPSICGAHAVNFPYKFLYKHIKHSLTDSGGCGDSSIGATKNICIVTRLLVHNIRRYLLAHTQHRGQKTTTAFMLYQQVFVH